MLTMTIHFEKMEEALVVSEFPYLMLKCVHEDYAWTFSTIWKVSGLMGRFYKLVKKELFVYLLSQTTFSETTTM